MRPGRLDRILYVGPPDAAGRIEILRIRTRNMSVDPALDLDALGALVRPTTPTFSSMLSHATDVDSILDEWMLWR